MSATLGEGGRLGLTLSAWIARNSLWQDLFWLSAVLAAVVFVLTLVVLPSVDDQHPAQIDVVRMIRLAVSLVATLVGVSKGSKWGWTDGRTISARARRRCRCRAGRCARRPAHPVAL